MKHAEESIAVVATTHGAGPTISAGDMPTCTTTLAVKACNCAYNKEDLLLPGFKTRVRRSMLYEKEKTHETAKSESESVSQSPRFNIVYAHHG
jgi:hypothetical protein